MLRLIRSAGKTLRDIVAAPETMRQPDVTDRIDLELRDREEIRARRRAMSGAYRW